MEVDGKDKSGRDDRERKVNKDRDRNNGEKRKRRSDDRDKHRKNDGRRRDEDRKRRQGRKKKSSRRRRSSSDHRRKRHKKKRSYSSSSDDSSSESSSSSDSTVEKSKTKKKVINERLLAKLSARGETLEERRERRGQNRAAQISTKFGYTADDNPFNDPNLHETFTWKKREESAPKASGDTSKKKDKTFDEIEKVRQRRKDREIQFQEMERIRAEESRMKELENYDDWARKEEEFHLQQQRQRSAIRLVEGREKPIDVLAKNLLLFGLSEEEKKKRAFVRYKERYNALDALENLEAELEEPHALLEMLKLDEIQELVIDIDAFRRLERESSLPADASALANFGDGGNPALKYWESLRIVAEDDIKYLKSGGAKGSHAKIVNDIKTIFEGQSIADLVKMKAEILEKLKHSGAMTAEGDSFDREYWQSVVEQLTVHLAKNELSELHEKMLVRQLETLEKKKEELARKPETEEVVDKKNDPESMPDKDPSQPVNVSPEFGNLEEELGLTNEIEMGGKVYAWQDKYRPRKPRFFNRVKTGYDWNKYNQTHYDPDNPPPKTVQGYKFNIFYPDLIDQSKTPQYFMEATDSDEFCIIRFHAGPPYEDIAFKIINREWNLSRKRGFKCTFERGILFLYFNFTTHWYRR